MELAVIINEAFTLFFEDDESEDEFENKRCVVCKNQNYAEEIVPQFSDKTFKTHFRMSPDVFEFICQEIYNFQTRNSGPGRNELPIEKQFMVTLWYLGNPECMRSIACRFGICIATVWRTVYNICDILLKLNHQKKFIKWPDADEQNQMSQHYLKKYKLRGVVGCIDGCHIPIRAPIRAHNSYINRKGFHSVLLQGVCNHKMEFIHCYTGEAGSIHDANLLRRSRLINKIDTGALFIANNGHLLGDSAYPLKIWLIPPFTDNGHLREEEKLFNIVHSQCRVVIERAFGMLKGRFRRLLHVNSLRPAAIVMYIMASCILHNICLQKDDLIDIVLSDEDNAFDEQNEILSQSSNAQTNAQAKRNDLMDSIFQ